MTVKGIDLTPALHDYLVSHSTPLDDVTAELVAETRAALPGDAGMQASPEQAVSCGC